MLALFAYLLKDAQGIGYGFLGSYIWLAAFVFTFFIGIFYFSQFILPLDWKDSWFEGMRLSLAYNFPLVGRLLGIWTADQEKAPAAGKFEALPKSLFVHGAGIVDSNLAMTTGRGIELNRTVGPGFVRLSKDENIDLIVDLRDQRRKLNVEALTRDGIPIKTEMSVEFRVKRKETVVEPNLPYPYDPEALFQISYINSAGDNQSQTGWAIQIIRFAETSFIAEISRYTFDELYQRESADGTSPLERIRRVVLSNLAIRFERYGIEVADFFFGHLWPPERIVEQKILNWKADWQQRSKMQEARSEARIDRGLRMARARAQVEIIENIAKNIEAMRREGEADLKDIVAFRMVEAMEKAISDEVVQSLVGEETRNNLASLERWLRGYPGWTAKPRDQ